MSDTQVPDQVCIERTEFNRIAMIVRDAHQRSVGIKHHDRLRQPALDAAMETIQAHSGNGEQKEEGRE